MSSQENPSPPFWTYRMEVSPTGQNPGAYAANMTDPIALLHLLINLQSQMLEVQRQTFEVERQQLELAREASAIARDQRMRQIAELERWQTSHEGVVDDCKEALSQLESVHAALMREMTDFIAENHENLREGDFSLTDFVDRFGPRLAHLNTMLSILRPLAAVIKKSDGN